MDPYGTLRLLRRPRGRRAGIDMETDKGPRYRQLPDADSKNPQEAKFFNVPEVHTAATLQSTATFWSIIRGEKYGAAEWFPEEGDPIHIQTIKGGRGIDDFEWSQPLQVEGAEQLRDRLYLMDPVVLL